MSQSPAAPNRYLDARVTTASQPELQLMLLDGALRFGQQALSLWGADEQRAECDRLVGRVLDIAEELLRSVASSESEPAQRLEEEYAFAFRQIAFSQLNHDAAALKAALRVLALERETWRLAFDKLKAEAVATAPTPSAPIQFSPTAESRFSLRA